MGAARKLQQEIDQCMKRVKEGLDSFDELHAKLDEDDLQDAQRTKLQDTLKVHIKKLQKHRDQIKTWVADRDVRDKQQLIDARGWIERRMERFKKVEQEAKQKPYGKAGLNKADRIDPRQAAIDACMEWLGTTLDVFQDKIDKNEAEMEELVNALKKKQEPPARVADLKELNIMHKKHTERLEQVQRALDNDIISPEDVDNLKDNVEDYLDQVADNMEIYEDTDAIYEELLDKLDNVEVHVPIVIPAVAARAPEVEKEAPKRQNKAEREAEKARNEAAKEHERQKAQAAAARAQIHKGGAFQSAQDDKTRAAAPLKEQAQLRQVPPLQHHASGSSSTSAATTTTTKTVQPPHSAWAGAGINAAAAVGADEPSVDTASDASLPAPRAPSANGAAPAANNMDALLPPPGMAVKSPTPEATVAALESAPAAPQATPPHASPTEAAVMPTAAVPGNGLVHQIPPHPFDCYWNRLSCARKRRYLSAPASYPVVPPKILDKPGTYAGMSSEDDLFMAFFMLPGTYYQFLAAQELTHRRWRYHMQHSAWYLMHDSVNDKKHLAAHDTLRFKCKVDRSPEMWSARQKKDFNFRNDQLESIATSRD